MNGDEQPLCGGVDVKLAITWSTYTVTSEEVVHGVVPAVTVMVLSPGVLNTEVTVCCEDKGVDGTMATMPPPRFHDVDVWLD